MCDAVFTPTGARISVGDDDDNNCDYGTIEWTLDDSLKLGNSKEKKKMTGKTIIGNPAEFM